MTFQDQILTALSNVGRRKLRSALASLGVVVGTLTIVFLVSLAAGVRRQINRQFESIGLDRMTVLPSNERRGGFDPFGTARRTKLITAEDVARWKGLPGVAKVIAEVNLPGSVELELKWNTNVQPVRVSSEQPMRGFRLEDQPAEPVAGSLELPEAGGIILSQGTAQAIGVSSNDFARFLGQSVEAILRTPRGESQNFALKVLGISQQRSRTVQISVADRLAMKTWWFNSTNLLEKQGYDLVTIRAADVGRAHALVPQLKREGFQVQSLEMIVEVANRVFTAITMMFSMVGGIALLVASIGIANTMVMAIYERTREIGILKAMGASRGEIRKMFMMEAGFIGLIGGVFGLLLAWLLGMVMNYAIDWYLRYRDLPLRGDFFVVSILLALGTIVFSTFIGVVAGLLPAQRAARLDPLEALRHE